jgi:predicted GNAT family N-acyltransferase
VKQVTDHEDQLTLRPARAGDGEAVFEVTRLSAAGLARNHYSAEQIAGWMGERTPAYYEDLIAHGRMVVAERGGVIVGFVDAVPGELTRLFILPDAAGNGLGRRLLQIGIEHARHGFDGSIRIEATLNAVEFYKHFGFKVIGKGYATHTLGGPPLPCVHMELSAIRHPRRKVSTTPAVTRKRP